MAAAVLRANRPECGRAPTSRSVTPNSPLIRGSWKLKPVELDLGRLARFTVRPHVIAAQGSRERGVAALIAQRDDLVEQGGRPQVRVVRESLAAVVQERSEGIRCLAPLAGRLLAVQIVANRLAVTAQMPGDRRDRPSLTTQSVCVHVFLPREHPGPGTGRPSSTRRLSTTHRRQFDTPSKITQRVGRSTEQVCRAPGAGAKKFKERHQPGCPLDSNHRRDGR